MLRSLFSGVSGLKAHQTMLDVAGNNIANVNTTGFKTSQTQFQDTLSQLMSSPSAAQAGVGGTNPAQVGLGVKVAGITTNFQQGAAQLTNRSTDMMISGDGFFTVKNGTEQMYTRAGSFNFDSTGQLVTADGALVQGWAATNGVIDTNGPLVNLQLPIGTLMGAKPTATATFAGNLPADATAAAAAVAAVLDDPSTTTNEAKAATPATVAAVLTKNVDVFDNLGVSQSLALTFTRTVDGWDVSATRGSSTAVTGKLAFDAKTGALASGSPLVVGGITVDLSAVTGFSGVSSVAAAGQNGQAAGNLQSFALNSDGTLMGAFTNGLKQAIGQLSIATFTNPTGLEKAGGSMYRTSVNSGAAQVGAAGTGSRGKLAGGALEMSNVDLSSEFTNLIIAQRGFQANARVITTSDQLLEELVNLKR